MVGSQIAILFTPAPDSIKVNYLHSIGTIQETAIVNDAQNCWRAWKMLNVFVFNRLIEMLH